jgi:hypothetical protein
MYESPQNITISAIDDSLNIQGQNNGGNDIEYQYSGIAYTSPNLYGTWRCIFTGNDDSWTEYKRDHSATQMLAVNYSTQKYNIRLGNSIVETDTIIS